MTRRPETTRVAEHPAAWYFGPQQCRQRYEGVFPQPGPHEGETIADYLERRYRALVRTGMSHEAVALSLRVEGRRQGDEAAADAVILWHERPNEGERR